MFGIVLRALGWLGTIALGWTVSDVYNEAQTTQQVSLGGVASAAGQSLKKKSKWYVWLGIILIIVAFILAKLGLFKSKRR